jgi:hypothetical protein
MTHLEAATWCLVVWAWGSYAAGVVLLVELMLLDIGEDEEGTP